MQMQHDNADAAGDNGHPHQGGVQEHEHDAQHGVAQHGGESSGSSDSDMRGNIVEQGSNGEQGSSGGDMMDALEMLGLDSQTSKWVIGSIEKDDSDMLDRIKQSWNRLKLYGKGGKIVKSHVTKMYSPPRVNSMIERLGMLPGISLDLTTAGPADNMPWESNLS